MAGRLDGPSFLVLTEDGAESARFTIEALFRAMCHLIIDGFDERQLHRRTFQPPPAKCRAALTANKWKSEKQADRRMITDLIETIVSHLLRPNTFVLFHFDGDRVYAQRALSENKRKFLTHLRAKVERALRDARLAAPSPTAPSPSSKREHEAPALTDAEVSAALTRLLPLTPFYCIETWTYYNIQKLRELCPRDHVVLERWEQAPGSVEELERPWEHISARKEHNRALAENNFPARRALEAARSFADTVHELRRNPELMAALAPLVYPGHAAP